MPTRETMAFEALKASYNEIVSTKKLRRVRVSHISNLRQYLLYGADLLGLYLRIQRDREYRDDWF